jgi:hypothetical protein
MIDQDKRLINELVGCSSRSAGGWVLWNHFARGGKA